MGERMTSPAEYAYMKSAINDCINDLERSGLGRSQIGAAMAGIGLGIVAAESASEAMKVLQSVSDAINVGRRN